MSLIRDALKPLNNTIILDEIKHLNPNNILILASSYGLINIIKYAINVGADIKYEDRLAIKKSLKAITNGHTLCAKYLISIDMDYDFAVRWAAYSGNLRLVIFYHKKGADITSDHNFAVRWAAIKGHLNVVKYLVKNGANITDCNNHAYIFSRSKEVCEYIEQITNKYL